MAVVVILLNGAREFDVGISDLKVEEDGSLIVKKNNSKVAQFTQGYWLGFEEVASSKILVAKPTTATQA